MASTASPASADSRISTSAANFFTAAIAWPRVSAWPTTRISSSRAKIFRSPARKMAWVSATITRMKWPLASLSGGCPACTSPPITGIVDINCLHALLALKVVFIDYDAYSATALFFKAPDNAATAIDLNIAFSAHNIGRQRDREIQTRAHGHV